MEYCRTATIQVQEIYLQIERIVTHVVNVNFLLQESKQKLMKTWEPMSFSS